MIDELPTIFFKGLDNLIATARSNRVAVCLGMQDFSQLTRDYGEHESKVIQNIVGNVIAGQVVGDTAETLSKRCGKILQQRKSVSFAQGSTTLSTNTQMDSLIPPSKISSLATMFFRILQCPVAIATVNDSADAVTVTFYLSGFPLRSRENSSMMKIPMHKVVGSR